jgi:hypothetical protein
MKLIELGVQLAIITAIALPILTVCFVILLEPSLRKQSPRGVKHYLSYLFIAPEILSFEDQNAAQPVSDIQKTRLRNQLLVRLGYIYLFVSLFVICNILAQFYLVADDLLQPVTQGGTDFVRTWVSITIYGPFIGGWKGSLPWYGYSLLPPLNGSTFHETWRWISFTQAVSSNSSIFGSSFSFLLITTVLTSTMFFVPLLLKSIRKSLVPSLFFYSTGVLIMTKSVFACLGQSLRLIFGETITYGVITINSTTGQLLPNLHLAIVVCSALIIVMFFITIVLGRKIWHIHYPDNEKSMRWFISAIMIVYWLSLTFNVVMI